MSRIGNAPITVPAGVEISIDKNVVKAKGPKGTLEQKIDSDLSLAFEDGQITVSRPTEQKRHKAMHGLYRTLISNIITGVSEGYVKELELVGVGYRASNSGQILELAVGYSHPIHVLIPEEVKLSTETKKGSPPLVRLESNDKQLIGQVAAKIRSLRKPEPYKGKGIRYKDEVLLRKAGKSAAKK